METLEKQAILWLFLQPCRRPGSRALDRDGPLKAFRVALRAFLKFFQHFLN